LLGERRKFSLLLFDFASDSFQLFADIECVLYGLCLFQNGQVLRFLGAHTQEESVVAAASVREALDRVGTAPAAQLALA
jgi:hypothetical protein